VNIDPYLRRLVSRALKEDLDGRGDITTRWFLPTRARYRARVTFKADGVLCGSAIAGEVFRQACPGARVRWLKRDGNRVRAGTVVARIEGPREIMTAERTALNFLQHLSGIATLASRYAAEARGTRARIYDTRKTLPGWRTLAKYAVRAGGGRNHRMGLYDMVLLKDNHLAGWAEGGIGIEEIRRRLRKFRRRHPRTAVLHGGLRDWKGIGGQVEKGAVKPVPAARFRPRLNREAIATVDDVVAGITRNDTIVLDVRSNDEYEGRLNDASGCEECDRLGHIPGSVWVEFSELTEGRYRLKPWQEVQARLAQAGVTPDKTLIPY